MESLAYFGFILFNIFLIGSACLTFSVFVFLLLFRVAMPSVFSRLPKAFREITIVISLLLFVFISIVGISEYFMIRENLYWANQPHVCFEAPFRQEYSIHINNHREGYLGTLFDRDESEAKVKSISEFAIVNDYLVGGSGLSSLSFFIFDLETGDYWPGLSKDEIISELKMSGEIINFPLTPILDYCEIVDCSPCDE